MLKRITRIANIGTFHDWWRDPAPELRKLTLIYGPNGTGKTTLCAILRSLARNEPDILKGRKTLGREGEARVEIELANGERCIFDGTSWNGPRPKIEIYDEQFVRDNLYTDVVEADHERNLYRVIVGEEAVEIAKEIAKLDDDGREIQRKLTELKKILDDEAKSGGMSFDALRKTPSRADIESDIDAREKDLASHRNAEKIAREAGLPALRVPEISADLWDILGHTLEHVAKDAEARLRAHLERCALGEDGRAWLERGVAFATGEICPFCGQGLAGAADLVAAYRGVFSDAYRNLKKQIEDARNRLTAEFGEAAQNRLGRTLSDAKDRMRFWKSYIPADWGALEQNVEWQEPWRAFFSSFDEALEAKRRAPLDPIPSEEVKKAAQALEVHLGKLRKLAKALAELNQKIEERKRSASAEKIPDVERELARLRLLRRRHQPGPDGLAEKFKEYDAKESEKNKIEGEKKQRKEKLESLVEQTMETCKKRVNELLGQFNAGFQVGTIRHDYRGGEPAAGWKIEIRETEVDLGNAKTPLSQPSFKNTLSAGDRSALAFAFFLAQLELKSDLGERIVVFDDPFTSLDTGREANTRSILTRRRSEFGQMIVLSHQPAFLADLDNTVRGKDNVTSLSLSWTEQSGSRVKEEDIHRLVADRMAIFEEKMIEFFRVGEGDAYEIASRLRPFFEQRLKVIFKDKVAADDTLGQMIPKLADALPKDIVEKCKKIKDYGNRYVHATATEKDSKPPDPVELRGMIRDVLDIFSALYRLP